MYTNPRISDSVVNNEDYAKRAAELGHGIISTCEHGWQGRYIEGYELAKKYNLKFVFGAEAYWVKDRLEKDRTNCHIFLAARNESGRQAINDILSEANISGMYGQTRIDTGLIFSLPKDDVIVTTACLQFWRYEDIDEIVERFKAHFGENLFLEVQYHNTEKQREINKRILVLSKNLNIPIIMGCDSHYIHEHGGQDRSDYINSKGIDYPDEEGWYLDYPSGDEAYKRFAKQCILGHDEIVEAMNNTNVFLEVEEYQNPCFTKDIKMPSLYSELSQDEKDALYEKTVWALWEKEKRNVPVDQHEKYIEEIGKEIDIVKITKHADYFLLDYEIVKRGIEKGGIITPTGRGSGVSFYTNKLLGFTDVDRISSKVKMYPERFMSPTRILETKSLADLDLNLGTPEIFAEAQSEIIGDGHSAPMIAYGTLKPSAAWKMYAKSQNVNFQLANEVSQQIKKWQRAVAQAPEDERDDIDVLDYIDKQYHEAYKKSEEYLGIVSDFKPHPCSYLVYQGDIRKEIGLIFIKPQKGEGKLCCVMDGKWAEEYVFLKNDLLKVSVAELIAKVYKRIGIKQHTVQELLDICTPKSKVWEIYSKGCTLGINQVEQPGTSHRVMKYKPVNISELCAFIAAIRPGFKSMYNIFESRRRFSYGIKSFDELIQTPEMPNTFVLYQEMLMATLNYAGVPMSECYEIIKNVAKKRIEKVLKYKTQFLSGFSEELIKRDNKKREEADKITLQVWQLIEDSSQYSFNASHSYCASVDSLYGAYLKSYYPLQFYEVFLNILEEKGEKDRMAAVKEEAENHFKILFPPYRFRQDNRSISMDAERYAINNSLKAIKGFGSGIGDILFEEGLQNHTSFMQLLKNLSRKSVKTSKIEPLIKIDYFLEFGNSAELIKINEMFDLFRQGEAKSISKEKVAASGLKPIIEKYSTGTSRNGSESSSYRINDINGLITECENYIKSLNLPDFDYKIKMASQLELLGYIDLTTNLPEDRRKLVILEIRPLIDNKTNLPWGYAANTKSIGSGKTARLSILSEVYDKAPLEKSDIIYAITVTKRKSGFWYLDEYKKLI